MGAVAFHLPTGGCFRPQNRGVFYQSVNLARGSQVLSLGISVVREKSSKMRMLSRFMLL